MHNLQQQTSTSDVKKEISKKIEILQNQIAIENEEKFKREQLLQQQKSKGLSNAEIANSENLLMMKKKAVNGNEDEKRPDFVEYKKALNDYEEAKMKIFVLNEESVKYISKIKELVLKLKGDIAKGEETKKERAVVKAAMAAKEKKEQEEFQLVQKHAEEKIEQQIREMNEENSFGMNEEKVEEKEEEITIAY